MKNWYVVLILILSWLQPALATNNEIDAEVQTPSNKRINKAECEDTDNPVELLITYFNFDLQRNKWDEDVSVDFFISESEKCSDRDFEIGGDADHTIGPDEDSVTFPDDFAEDQKFNFGKLVKNGTIDCSEHDGKFYFCMEWSDTVLDQFLEEKEYTLFGAAEIQLDFVLPQSPSKVEAIGGETNLQIKWTPPTNTTDIQKYRAYCARKDDLGNQPEALTEAERQTKLAGKCDGNTGDTQCTIKNLVNDETYVVWVVAEDDAENQSDAWVSTEGTPKSVFDFYEYYNEMGGMDQGGFCFVATAAYGSYNDPMVMQLRHFRDSVLAGNSTGELIIDTYYRLGPRWARAIRGSETHKTVARWSLAPAVGLVQLGQAGIFEWLLIVFSAVLLVVGILRFRRFLARVIQKSQAALLVLVLCTAANAQADEFDQPSNVSAPGYQLQLRFGPYLPEFDGTYISPSNPSGTNPFKEIFGDSSEFLFELGIDYQIWRGFGAVTAGVSAGFVQYLGKGRIQVEEEGATENSPPTFIVSNDTTIINLVPLRLTAGYHLSFLYDNWNIPLVPYVQCGLSYYIWWVTDGVGDVSDNGYGGVFGLHLGTGLKFLLDILDPTAAANLETDIGVINTFLFAEFNTNWVDGITSTQKLDLSDNTVTFGLMMEF